MNTPTKISFFLFAMGLSFYAGKEIASNEIYASIESYRKANPIEDVGVLIPHKTHNPKLKQKGD